MNPNEMIVLIAVFIFAGILFSGLILIAESFEGAYLPLRESIEYYLQNSNDD